ncbi:MAG: restriction endonuclease subunit M [Anaerolineae bacterium]|jgi:DNA modification methylase|nr:MAG: restriction endonuclease subunit M [Anaerolineae bacterium]
MVTKEEIEKLKQDGNGALSQLLSRVQDGTQLAFILQNLGALPKNFDGTVLLSYVNHPDHRIRFWVVKNLGKLEDIRYVETFIGVARQDSNSMVRREAVSSIGRMRDPRNIPALIDFLNDPDPKIVAQAIRGLLVFKGNTTVDTTLRRLVNHRNELIQQIIYKEYFSTSSEKSQLPHPATHHFLKNVVVHGDVREVLRYVPENSIHLTFTSPPYYNARDYSIYPSYKDYLEFLAGIFQEVLRVTKEGRFFVLNTSPIIIPRISRQHSSKRYPIPFDIHPYLVEMGWEFIDDIVWVKPESSAKNRNAGFLQHRKPLAYKPNPVTEYLMVYRKKTDKLIDWNLKQYDWDTIEASKVLGKYETSNVWLLDPKYDKEHSAVFPIELCYRVIQYYSLRGDLVFDPFAGSGTVGHAALNLGRHFFLTEIDLRYFQLIEKNLGGGDLFTPIKPRFLSLEKFVEIVSFE